jgi:ATP-binding cassette subfamily B protein
VSHTEVGLQLDEVSYRHGERTILDKQTWVVPSGSALVVTGANGVGKSTLLYICAGLVPADSGQVRLGGTLAKIGRAHV